MSLGLAWLGLGARKQLGAPESEARVSFVWRGRATFSGAEEEEGGEGEGEGKRGEEGERSGSGQQWVDTRGLLSKIVDVFMKEPMDSLYRFWLASCVEAFLRGGRCAFFLFRCPLVCCLFSAAVEGSLWCACFGRCRCVAVLGLVSGVVPQVGVFCGSLVWCGGCRRWLMARLCLCLRCC